MSENTQIEAVNICVYCECQTNNTEKSTYDEVSKWAVLCDDCISNFEDKTGYCSIDCCVSGRCDESC
jgi:hypothetical protein